MNATSDFPADSNKTCEGRCIIEMQKVLEPSVIVEFFEVIRDFHNDDRTAIKLKNMILSETSEAVKLLKERASEMILMVDEIFLNRRQRQTSFYRLLHKLARKGLPEGSHLPDESKCICFSEENLRRFGVDPGASTSLEFSSNLSSVKEALKQYFGELRCTECGRYMQLCQSGSMLSCISDCSCSSPSVSSQHKVHEAILELCKAKDNAMMCQDSWYLTQLKRDADYYRDRSRQSSVCFSDESLNSFEVITPPTHANFEDDVMDSGSLCSDLTSQEKMPGSSNKFLDLPQAVNKCSNGDVGSNTDIQHLSKNLSNKLMQCFPAPSHTTTNLTDASKRNSSSLSSVDGVETMKVCEKKFSPAFLLRQSFSPYFSKKKNTQKYCLPSYVPPMEYIKFRLQELHVDSKLRDVPNKVINPIQNQKKSSPTDSLRCALSVYLSKEMSGNWLRN